MYPHIKLADGSTRLVHPWEGQRLGPKLLGQGHLVEQIMVRNNVQMIDVDRN